jgi:hypothetical protein
MRVINWGGGKFKGNKEKNKHKDKKHDNIVIITNDNKAHQKWRI